VWHLKYFNDCENCHCIYIYLFGATPFQCLRRIVKIARKDFGRVRLVPMNEDLIAYFLSAEFFITFFIIQYSVETNP